MQNGFGLSPISLLFHIVTPFALDKDRVFSFLVLGNFVDRVAFELTAVGSDRLRDVDHIDHYLKENLNTKKIILE